MATPKHFTAICQNCGAQQALFDADGKFNIGDVVDGGTCIKFCNRKQSTKQELVDQWG